jgi:hypothetical protein
MCHGLAMMYPIDDAIIELQVCVISVRRKRSCEDIVTMLGSSNNRKRASGSSSGTSTIENIQQKHQ